MARIDTYEKKEIIQEPLRSDCSQCAPTGIRMILSLATLSKWRITKVGVKRAILRIGRADKDV